MSKIKQQLGRQGEQVAVDYLRNLGFSILDRNFRTHRVELDIVAREGQTLVFCEVKTRQSSQYGSPLEAITVQKRNNLRRAALGWLAQHRINTQLMRFDVIGVLYALDGRYTVTHIRGID